jgi:dTMP kinase
MFITLEGGEGSGKTTIQQRLVAWLKSQDTVEWAKTEYFYVLAAKQPGGTALGAKLRTLLLESEGMEPTAEIFLFLADRAQHVAMLRERLQGDTIVVCDRYTDSTLAYQGYGRGYPLSTLKILNAIATGGLTPDLTLLLDVDPAIGLVRRKREGGVNRLDAEKLAFHQRVRAGYRELAAQEPERWRVIGASRDIDDVWDEVQSTVATAIWGREMAKLPAGTTLSMAEQMARLGLWLIGDG